MFGPGYEAVSPEARGPMARRRTLNYKELRDHYDAAERRKQEEEGAEGEEEDLDEDEEEEGGAEASDEDEGGDEEDEEAPKKKRKAPVKEAKPKRVRTPKQVRQRVVWVVFNNSHQRVQSFEYARKREAEEYAAKLQAEKKSTFFIQPVKEPIEEK